MSSNLSYMIIIMISIKNSIKMMVAWKEAQMMAVEWMTWKAWTAWKVWTAWTAWMAWMEWEMKVSEAWKVTWSSSMKGAVHLLAAWTKSLPRTEK
jgi:hypothetical protein